MKKLVHFMHVSLDGYAAGPKGEMDWIHVDDEIFEFVGERTNVADTALYGRKTWEMMEGYWPKAGEFPNASRHDKEHSAWYNKVQKVVISNSMAGKQHPKTTFIGPNLKTEVQGLKQQPGEEIIMFGSPGAAHALMKEDLIDEYWLFVNPVILGEGIPQFAGIQSRQQLKLLGSHPFKSGVVCLKYARLVTV